MSQETSSPLQKLSQRIAHKENSKMKGLNHILCDEARKVCSRHQRTAEKRWKVHFCRVSVFQYFALLFQTFIARIQNVRARRRSEEKQTREPRKGIGILGSVGEKWEKLRNLSPRTWSTSQREFPPRIFRFLFNDDRDERKLIDREARWPRAPETTKNITKKYFSTILPRERDSREAFKGLIGI